MNDLLQASASWQGYLWSINNQKIISYENNNQITRHGDRSYLFDLFCRDGAKHRHKNKNYNNENLCNRKRNAGRRVTDRGAIKISIAEFL